MVWWYDGDQVYLDWYITKKRSSFNYSSFYSCQSEVGSLKREERGGEAPIDDIDQNQ